MKKAINLILALGIFGFAGNAMAESGGFNGDISAMRRYVDVNDATFTELVINNLTAIAQDNPLANGSCNLANNNTVYLRVKNGADGTTDKPLLAMLLTARATGVNGMTFYWDDAAGHCEMNGFLF
jgi:hypothetical protein